MQSDLLVVPVDRAFGIHLEPALALALRAATRPELSLLILDKRPECGHASHAVKPTDFKLREHAAATRDYTADVDKLVQVQIADVADVARRGALGKPFDSNKDFLGDSLTARW